MNRKINLKQVSIVFSTALILSACGGGSSSSSTNSDSGNNTNSSITHNGTTYGTVTSPYTGRIWLDRNLGAARVCESYNDTACYGDYYQWGRNTDGHQDSGSAVTTTIANNINSVGTAFIISNTKSNYYDWAIVDTDGSKRANNWLKLDASSICPLGFRVASFQELKAETLDNGVNNIYTAFANFLKLPSAGVRHRKDASMYNIGLWGSLWTSSINGLGSYGIHFHMDDATSYDYDVRAYGRSVRCIKG